MIRKAMAMFLILGLVLPAAAFGAEASDKGVVRSVVEFWETFDESNLWRDVASGAILGAIAGGSINQLGRMDDMAMMITSGAALGAVAGLVIHYTGRSSLLTVENDQLRLAMPVILPTYQVSKGREDIGVRASIITVNY